MLIHRLASCLLFTVLCGCGATSGDDDELVLGTNQAALKGAAPTSMSAAQTAASVATAGVIDGSKSAGANADAIAAELASKCPSAQVTHQSGSVTVTVDFGTGCTREGYGTLSGQMSLTVSQASGKVTVAMALKKLTVNQVQLQGTISVTTSDGKSYDVALDMSAAGYQVIFTGTAGLDQDGKGVVLSGAGSLKGSSAAVPYVATLLHHRFGGCYADAGSLTVTETTQGKLGKPVMVTAVVAFLSTTPSTGVATVTASGRVTQKTLPAYGSCPQ